MRSLPRPNRVGDTNESRFLGSALAVAGLMGALGCTIAGTAGVAGMLAGVLAAGAPLLVTARR